MDSGGLGAGPTGGFRALRSEQQVSAQGRKRVWDVAPLLGQCQIEPILPAQQI